MGVADQAVADAILGHQLDLLRLEAGVRSRIIRLLNLLQLDLASQLSVPGLPGYTKARLQALLRQANESIDGYYARIQGELDLVLSGVGEIQAPHMIKSLTISTGANLPTETFLTRLVSNVLIHGAPSSEWWGRQSQDTAFRFSAAVRQGVAQGETNEQIVARITGKPRLGIPGVMDISRKNARGLVHSSIQTVANSSRMETFRKNPGVVTGVRQLSTFDSHTTAICIAYSGGEWDMEGNPINGTKLPFVNEGGSLDGTPRHWGCRSVMTPITKTFKQLGLNIAEIKPGQRAAAGGPVSSRTTMEQWLSRRTKEQQDEQLGPGRADLWRRKVITLEQLLNLSGNPLTLAQLRARYT